MGWVPWMERMRVDFGAVEASCRWGQVAIIVFPSFFFIHPFFTYTPTLASSSPLHSPVTMSEPPVDQKPKPDGVFSLQAPRPFVVASPSCPAFNWARG